MVQELLRVAGSLIFLCTRHGCDPDREHWQEAAGWRPTDPNQVSALLRSNHAKAEVWWRDSDHVVLRATRTA
jgi:hypothetical protein